MSHTKILTYFTDAVNYVSDHIADYAYQPGSDFTRKNKLPPEKLIPFLVTQGSGSTKNELTKAFDFSADHPSASAFTQQRAKLKPEGIAALFYRFNAALDSLHPDGKYRFIAADGTTFTYLSNEKFSSPEFFSKQGNSYDGCYSIHAIATLDLETNTYTDCVLQPIKQKNEYGALAAIVDRHPIPDNSSLVFLADRGFCSYNNMAHVIERGQFFLFRSKDVLSKGLLHHIDLPPSDSFDIDLRLIIIRKQMKSRPLPDGYVRFVNHDTSFDFLEYGSSDYYVLPLRVVRFEISPGVFECLVTNLSRDDFPPETLNALYHCRWNEETSFRSLKYTIGLSKFHASKAVFVLQEIWARLVFYNFISAVINLAVLPHKTATKYSYKINFSSAVTICREFLRSSPSDCSLDVFALLNRDLTPIRKNRQFPRLHTAHFRRPAYFHYRPS